MQPHRRGLQWAYRGNGPLRNSRRRSARPGDVLAGFSGILRELQVHCDLRLPGAFEIGRQGILPNSPIAWNDSGTLGVTREVPGGTIDPGKMLSGLAQAASKRGALILE